ncbi:MAG TPA: hypothetical protein VIU40_02325 [Geobacteraceae bacterium]
MMKASRLLIPSIALVFLLAAGSALAGSGLKIPLPPIPGVNVPLPLPPVPGVAPKHLYRYFPDVEVYFDPGRSLYFFLDADVWRSATVPPPGIVVKGLPSTDLDIDDDVPYRSHGDVRKHYPPGQYKKHRGNGDDQGHDEGGRGRGGKRGGGKGHHDRDEDED